VVAFVGAFVDCVDALSTTLHTSGLLEHICFLQAPGLPPPSDQQILAAPLAARRCSESWATTTLSAMGYCREISSVAAIVQSSGTVTRPTPRDGATLFGARREKENRDPGVRAAANRAQPHSRVSGGSPGSDPAERP